MVRAELLPGLGPDLDFAKLERLAAFSLREAQLQVAVCTFEVHGDIFDIVTGCLLGRGSQSLPRLAVPARAHFQGRLSCRSNLRWHRCWHL